MLPLISLIFLSPLQEVQSGSSSVVTRKFKNFKEKVRNGGQERVKEGTELERFSTGYLSVTSYFVVSVTAF